MSREIVAGHWASVFQEQLGTAVGRLRDLLDLREGNSTTDKLSPSPSRVTGERSRVVRRRHQGSWRPIVVGVRRCCATVQWAALDPT
ncbi:hypothetical protein [Streptomyces pristinaespiralis]|uniref:hypothetical protein n=1 Tax=Streptomyces pristinaespiralis TaxID=38300 RepID=UPI00384BEFB0